MLYTITPTHLHIDSIPDFDIDFSDIRVCDFNNLFYRTDFKLLPDILKWYFFDNAAFRAIFSNLKAHGLKTKIANILHIDTEKITFNQNKIIISYEN